MIALLLALFLGVGLIYRGERQAQARAQAQIEKILPVLQKPAPDMARAQATLEQLQGRVSAARAAFPGRDRSIEFSRTLEQLASFYGVRITKQDVSTTSKRQENIDFYLLTFDLTLEGEVAKLLDFVSGLDGKLKTASISSATITVPRPEEKPGAGKDGKAEELKVPTLEVKVAIYCEGKEVSLKEATPKAKEIAPKK